MEYNFCPKICKGCESGDPSEQGCISSLQKEELSTLIHSAFIDWMDEMNLLLDKIESSRNS